MKERKCIEMKFMKNQRNCLTFVVFVKILGIDQNSSTAKSSKTLY